MGLFSKRTKPSFDIEEAFFDDYDDILNEFDAGNGENETEENPQELETIDDENPEAETAPQAQQQEEQPQDTENNNTPQEEPNNNGNEENPEIETIDDENPEGGEEPPQDQPADTPEDTGDDMGNDLETIDDDEDGMQADAGEEQPQDDTGNETDTGTDTMGDGNDPHQKLKELEAEIFDQLSDQEKEIKKNELKKLFITLIERTDNILDLVQEVPKTDETVKVIDYVANTLTDLKTYLNDYVTNMYDIKTYIQNTVNFQKFLAIFDSVKAIFEEIGKMTNQ